MVREQIGPVEIWSSLQGKLQADEHDQGASSIDQPWKYVGVRKRRQKRTRIRTCGKGALKAFHCPATSKKGKVDKVGSFIQPLQRESVFFKPLRELACQGGEKGGQAELSSTLCSGVLIQVEQSNRQKTNKQTIKKKEGRASRVELDTG